LTELELGRDNRKGEVLGTTAKYWLRLLRKNMLRTEEK
jgi:hypothetical protein